MKKLKSIINNILYKFGYQPINEPVCVKYQSKFVKFEKLKLKAEVAKPFRDDRNSRNAEQQLLRIAKAQLERQLSEQILPYAEYKLVEQPYPREDVVELELSVWIANSNQDV